MPTMTLNSPLGELTIETEMVDVTSNLPRPDKNWRFTDENGHEHYWQDNDWPTLVTVVDETYWCEDCGDDHQNTHLACAICGVTVEPGMVRPPGHREFVPGRKAYYLDGEPITEERANEIINAARG
jgi:hypothetical protein